MVILSNDGNNSGNNSNQNLILAQSASKKKALGINKSHWLFHIHSKQPTNSRAQGPPIIQLLGIKLLNMGHLLLPSTIISTYKEQTNMFFFPPNSLQEYICYFCLGKFKIILVAPYLSQYKLLATAMSILATIFNSVPSQLAVGVNDLGSSQAVQILSWELVKKDVKIWPIRVFWVWEEGH